MRVVFPKANKFKNLTQVLTKIVDEAPIFVSDAGLSCKTLSEDKTTMIVITIPSESFDQLELEESLSFKVDTREFHRIARRGTRNDVLEIEVDRENRILKMSFRDKKTSIVRSFDLPVSFEGVEEPGEPKVDLPITFEMLAGDFKDIISDAKIVGEEMEFRYDGEKIIIKAESVGRTYEAVLAENEPLLSLTGESSEATARYGVDLLQAATKAATSSSTVRISFGPGLPMRLYFEIPDIGSMIYWVAPRA